MEVSIAAFRTTVATLAWSLHNGSILLGGTDFECSQHSVVTFTARPPEAEAVG